MRKSILKFIVILLIFVSSSYQLNAMTEENTENPSAPPQSTFHANTKPLGEANSPFIIKAKASTPKLTEEKKKLNRPPQKPEKPTLTDPQPTEIPSLPIKQRKSKSKRGRHKLTPSSIDSFISRKIRKAAQQQPTQITTAATPHRIEERNDQEPAPVVQDVRIEEERLHEILALPEENAPPPPLPQRFQEEAPLIQDLERNEERIHEILALPEENAPPPLPQLSTQPVMLSVPYFYQPEPVVRITKTSTTKSLKTHIRSQKRKLERLERKRRAQLRRKRVAARKLSAQKARHDHYLALKASREKRRMEQLQKSLKISQAFLPSEIQSSSPWP